MSDAIPTITIDTENGPVVINMSDFDPTVHKIAGAEPSFDREAAVAYLNEKGVQFAKNIGEKKLIELVEATKAAEVPKE